MSAQQERPPGIGQVARKLGADETLQRTAWILLSALLAAVALGLFGRGGPLSDVQAAARDGSLALAYQRFIRYHSPDELTVTLPAGGTTASVLLDGRYVARIEIEHVTPEPERVVSEGDALRFHFHTTPGSRLRATFHYSARHYGSLEGWIAAGGGTRVPIRQFTYP